MKIVYMGTPDFAVGPLEALIENGYEVTAVVTQPDKAKGRSGKLTASPVKECARMHGIPVLQPERIKTSEAVGELSRYEADIFVVAAFGQILSKEILDMPKYGCINIHASLLPKYRGAAPIQWAIIDGEKETGVTIMQMDVGLDTGDILTQKVVPIASDETGESLFEKLREAGGQLLIETLPKIEAGSVTRTPQDGEKSTYAKMLTKELGNIDFAKGADEIEHLIRGLTPWPSAYTYYGKRSMKIWQAQAAAQTDAQTTGIAGQIAAVGRDFIDVACGSGILRVFEIQPEGKKRMSVRDFMLGHKLEIGMKFTRQRADE